MWHGYGVKILINHSFFHFWRFSNFCIPFLAETKSFIK